MRALHWRWQGQSKTASSDKRRIAPAHICNLPAANELTAGGDQEWMEIGPMKKILLSAAVVMLFASPALAQSYNPDFGTGNVINLPALEHGSGYSESYAYEPAPAHVRREFHSRHVRHHLRRD
jgi:hypothetical protein